MEDTARVSTEKAVNYAKFLKFRLQNLTIKALKLEGNEKVVIVKRNKQLKDGDYAIITLQSASTSSDRAAINEEVKNDSLFKGIAEDRKGHLVAFLDRCQVFQHAISTAVNQGAAYGSTDPSSDDVAIVNPFPFLDIAEDVSLDNVRAVLLSQHISALLQANGLPTVFQRRSISLKAEKTLDLFGVNMQSIQTDVKPPCDALEVLKSSEYCESNENSFVINLKNFAKDHPNVPKTNIANFLFTDDSNDVISEIDCVKHAVDTMKSRSCFHVVHFKKQFQMQQFDLLWEVHREKSPSQIQQTAFVYGSVSSQEKTVPVLNALDFYQLRYKQMQEASEMKYGEVVKEASWEDTIHNITVAGIKFELLSMVAHQQANLDFKENESAAQGNKGGVFVMYNCARLSTLFSKYEKAVEEGVYPSLPPVSEIDFSTLHEEDEWSLVFNYVVLYPDLVQNCVFLNGTQAHCHKVCQFLQDFCRDLSSYYSRTHVLGEPRQHLMPLMFARLYLLRSVYQVLRNGLTLLGLQPMHQL